VLLHFTSSAPIAVTALGPHKLVVDAAVLSGPSQAAQPSLLLVTSTLDAITTTAPVLGGLWRSSALPAVPASYAVLLKRGSVDDRLGCLVRLTDPLGRSTERSITIAAGPVDPPPDVLDLQLIHIGGGTNISWHSGAPTGLRAGGRYRVRITLTLATKVIVPPKPLPLPVIRPALTSSSGVRGSVAAILRKPVLDEIGAARDLAGVAGVGIGGIGGIRPKTLHIDMALGDIAPTGNAPAPTLAQPWKLERQNGVHGSTSYALVVDAKVTSVTVRITAPDGRFSEEVAP
jgi:hypothetical protein